MEVSIRELKNRLSEYLKRAQAGEDVVITSHGRAVARLTPLPPDTGHRPTLAELERRLRAIPGVRLGKGRKPKGAMRPLRIKPGEKSLSDIVLEDRR